MTTKWKDLRDDLLASPEAKVAYQRARRDFEIGMQIRQLREAAGISQAELARRMGTSQPAVARLEAGGGTPKIDTLEKAATALGAELVVQLIPTRRKLRAVGAVAKPARRATKQSAVAGAAKQPAATARVTTKPTTPSVKTKTTPPSQGV
jgi:HTH-type transcriptional regulator / antitoxin HipB